MRIYFIYYFRICSIYVYLPMFYVYLLVYLRVLMFLFTCSNVCISVLIYMCSYECIYMYLRIKYLFTCIYF